MPNRLNIEPRLVDVKTNRRNGWQLTWRPNLGKLSNLKTRFSGMGRENTLKRLTLTCLKTGCRTGTKWLDLEAHVMPPDMGVDVEAWVLQQS
jgi:hypothetical protein